MRRTLERCTFCLAKGACEIRYDVKSRPYLVCSHCGVRVFIRDIGSLTGLAIIPKLVDAAIAKRESNSEYRAWFDGAVAELVAEVRSAAPTEKRRGLPEQPVQPFVMGEVEEKKA